MNRSAMIIGTLIVASIATFTCRAGAGPQGPGKETVLICHYCDLHNQYNTLEVGLASAAQHLAEHEDDYSGPCR